MSDSAGIILRGVGFERGIWSGGQLHFVPPYPDVIHVVRDRETGAIDILDEPVDEPKPTEESFAFRLDRKSLQHVCFRDRGRHSSGWYVSYDLVDEPIPAPPGKVERTQAAG